MKKDKMIVLTEEQNKRLSIHDTVQGVRELARIATHILSGVVKTMDISHEILEDISSGHTVEVRHNQKIRRKQRERQLKESAPVEVAVSPADIPVKPRPPRRPPMPPSPPPRPPQPRPLYAAEIHAAEIHAAKPKLKIKAPKNLINTGGKDKDGK